MTFTYRPVQENRPRTVMLGRIGYADPRPPPGHGPHRYIFQIYAMAERCDEPAVPNLAATIIHVAKSALARGRLIGMSERA
jgi:phosphatidylethanolamine-binding protein (PEBP) family uncharacterized protein